MVQQLFVAFNLQKYTKKIKTRKKKAIFFKYKNKSPATVSVAGDLLNYIIIL